MTDDELLDLISALIDGELDEAEEAEVRALLQRSPEAQQGFDDLAQVRLLLRDLPAVDAPFGFYERLLRPPRAKRSWPKVATAFASAAAAVVLIVGITPATDSIIPPVQAFAARHDQMGAPSAPAAMDFEAMPAPMLDTMAAPYAAPAAMMGGSMPRMSGYHTSDGVLHVMYGDGTFTVSIYEQPGSVAWDRLPDGGKTMTLAGDSAWTMRTPVDEVIVLVRGPIVYTVVTAAPHEAMMAMAAELPRPPDVGPTQRALSACRAVAVRFGFGE